MNNNNLYKHLLHAVALCLRDIRTGMDKAAAAQDGKGVAELLILEGFFLAIGDRLMIAMAQAQAQSARAAQTTENVQ